MQNFREIAPAQWDSNVFTALSKNWMLVTVQNGESANPMTAAWGGFGVMWKKPAVFVMIRKSRFTKELVDKAQQFSLAFLPDSFREQYQICGSKSGRDLDKIAACGFTIAQDGDTPYITQAHTVLLCKKLYCQEMDSSCFILPEMDAANYGDGDYHVVYIAEIEKVLVK